MKKTILVFVNLLALAASTMAQSPFSCATNSDNTLTVTGYNGSGGVVSIPTNINGLTVTGIGWEAFIFHDSVTSVTIPGSITNIGDDAFYHCTNLVSVIISNGVTDIGNYMFFMCPNLASVTIPAGITNIGDDAFFFCFDLSNLAIPESLASIGSQAFVGTGLTNVTIPNSVSAIGYAAFATCGSVTNVVLGDGITSIEQQTFADCGSLTTMVIPRNIASIGYLAFEECSNLADVYFTGNAPNADSTVFSEDNSVTIYYLPSTTGWDAFSANTDLPAVMWNPTIQTTDGTFGVQNNKFGFTIAGTNNFTVTVEACSNLANPVWTPLGSVVLTNGSAHFSDPNWTNYSARFYGLGFP